MSGPEHEQEPEELELLDEDSVVAQQSSAHAPQKRVRVSESPGSSVVVDDGLANGRAPQAAGRALPAYGSWNEETVVVRGRRKRAPAKPKKRSWASIAIWIVAGAAAFGLGGVLALLDDSGGSGAGQASSEPAAAPDPQPVVPVASAAPAPAEDDPAESAEPEEADTATLNDLPVEPVPAVARPKRPAAPAKPVQNPKPPTAPAAKPAPAKIGPKKTEIPTGI